MTVETMRAAATVVLVRERRTGPEVLMLRRSPDSPAFPGMWVFPGGSVNDVDREHPDPLAAAAVRECAEECGVVVEATRLVQLSEWMPPPSARHRFQTAFFLVDPGEQDVTIDGFEVVEARWIAPHAALELHARGMWDFLPPTWVTLHALGEMPFTAVRPPDAAIQRFYSEVVGKEPTILGWEGDEDHSNLLGTAGAQHRLTLGTRPWTYKRTTGGQ